MEDTLYYITQMKELWLKKLFEKGEELKIRFLKNSGSDTYSDYIVIISVHIL